MGESFHSESTWLQGNSTLESFLEDDTHGFNVRVVKEHENKYEGDSRLTIAITWTAEVRMMGEIIWEATYKEHFFDASEAIARAKQDFTGALDKALS